MSQLREQARQIAEQCKRDLGADSVKVAIGGKEWRMAKTDECLDAHWRKSSRTDGQTCRTCRTIGIFNYGWDNTMIRHTAYHEILHILTGLGNEHNWLLDICATILRGEEVKQSIIKEWGEFVNAPNPFPDREALISIIQGKSK